MFKQFALTNLLDIPLGGMKFGITVFLPANTPIQSDKEMLNYSNKMSVSLLLHATLMCLHQR